MSPVCGRTIIVLSAAVAMSCSGTGVPTIPSGANTFTGAVDGVPFVASTSSISTSSDAGPGSLSISGTEEGGTFRTVILRLGFLNGPGTYPLGVSRSTTPGGIVELLTGQNNFISSFTTPLSGVAGSVTIASLTPTAIVGTFQASTPPTPPQAGITHIVTGSFNVPIAGGFVLATAANPGSVITATLNGTSFVAGTVTTAASGGGFTLTGTSTSASGTVTQITLTLPGTAVGTYPFLSTTGAAVGVAVVLNGAAYGGGIAGDAGSVVITAASPAGVVQGTLSGTLSGGLTIASGQFAVKLPAGS
jgi:hypothetical protein